MKVRTIVAAASTSLFFATVAAAQPAQPQPRPAQPPRVQVQIGQPTQPGQRVQRHPMMTTDQKLATCLAISNQEEIAIAQFAQDKAQNNDVKSFAQTLAQDHRNFLNKLKKWAPEAARDGYLDEGNRNVNRTSGQSAVQQVKDEITEAKPATVGQEVAADEVNPDQIGHLDITQLHRELAEECIRHAKMEMNQKEGKEFDRCFVGHQIGKHAEMKVKLIVFERHATGDLKQVIADGIEVTERHKRRAEELLKQLERSDPRQTRLERGEIEK